MTSYVLPMDLPRLDAALRDSTSATAEVRWVAAVSLAGRHGEPRAVEALGALLCDPVEEVRAQAVEGLVSHLRAGAEIERGALAAVLKDPCEAVRCAVVSSIDVVFDDWETRALAALTDEAASVRATAARLLGETELRDARPQLEALLADEDPIVAREAAVALAALGDAAGISTLLTMLSEGGHDAYTAALALGRAADRRAVPALEKVAAGWFTAPDLKAAAAVASIVCGGRKGEETLARMLASPRRGARMSAYRALSILPIPGFVDALGGRVAEAGALEASSAVLALVSLAAVEPVRVRTLLEGLRANAGAELAEEIAQALMEIEEA